MSVKVAINGFGRIGRLAFSVSAEGSASDSSYIYSPAIVAFSVEL